jgi:hypothetical protein
MRGVKIVRFFCKSTLLCSMRVASATRALVFVIMRRAGTTTALLPVTAEEVSHGVYDAALVVATAETLFARPEGGTVASRDNVSVATKAYGAC